MRKRGSLFIIFVLLIQFFCVHFCYAEALESDQPKTCRGPSEMMGYYFDFQGEMKQILMGSQINYERFSLTYETGGLFTNRVLDLNSMSAIELVSSSVVGNFKSFVSNSVTSLVLLELAAFSVVQSNTEGFAILFADWPIVRDYKHMLDIETQLFDIAYFRSKQIPLTRPLDSEGIEKLKSVINKYQKLGLLEEKKGGIGEIHGSFSDLLLDLVSMNASMKQFIMVGGEVGKSGLRKYNGCFGNMDKDKCTREFAILSFSGGAIDQLYDDYKDVRSFSKCNSYANYFRGTINKTIDNNVDMVSTAMKDVDDSIKRLRNALFKTERRDFRDPCKDLSDYEMAQLQAYWGGNWKCGYGINPFTAKEYINDKLAHIKQKSGISDVLRKSKSSKNSGVLDNNLKTLTMDSQKSQRYRELIGSGSFNRYYDFDLLSGFLYLFETTMDEYSQAQETAIAGDVSGLFPHFRGVLDQVDSITSGTNALQSELHKINAIQCSR